MSEEPLDMTAINERMRLQSKEFSAASSFAVAQRALSQTAVVDDDYSRTRHYYEGALQDLLLACKANGRFDPGSRFNPGGGNVTIGTLSVDITTTLMDEGVFTNLREANIARQKEWDAHSKIILSYRGNEMAGEAGEACNVIKKLERERLGILGSRDTVEHLGQELADVIICADLIALSEDIDLNRAVALKFNSSSEKLDLKTRMAVP